MSFSGLSRWAALVVCALVANVGCDGDGSGSGGTGGEAGKGGNGGEGGTGGGTGGTGGGTGGSSTGGTGGTTATGGTGGGDQFAVCEGKFMNQSAECQTCVQDSCAETLIACCETAGCPEIIACARENMCGGLDCYSGPGGAAGPCKAEIDANGGPLGEAAAAAGDFGGCAQPACPVCTQP